MRETPHQDFRPALRVHNSWWGGKEKRLLRLVLPWVPFVRLWWVNTTVSFSQLPSSVIPSASPAPQGSSSRFPQSDVFGTQLVDGGPIEDFVPHADVGIDDVQMVDEGTPAMTLSSQENTAALALPSWNLIVGLFAF